MPGQWLRPLAPTNERRVYETRVPTGVDALKIARCFLHSATGRDVESRDVVSASAVGAISDIHR